MLNSLNNIPDGADIKIIGWTMESKDEIQGMLYGLVNKIGEKIDLSGLDGVTFAFDYKKALLDLDRGYDNLKPVAPSNGNVVGVAMSPKVLRNGKMKTHVVIDANSFFGLMYGGKSGSAMNTLAHECAHVELYNLYEQEFPGAIFKEKTNSLDAFRNDCMLACWNEFGACWRSAPWGPSELLAYESLFISALERCELEAGDYIANYWNDNNVSVAVNGVCHSYGRLLKYAAYHLGNIHGNDKDWRSVSSTFDRLKDHWFLDFFDRLDIACKNIAESIGDWKNCSGFEDLGDIAEEIVAYGGVKFFRHENNKITVNIS